MALPVSEAPKETVLEGPAIVPQFTGGCHYQNARLP
jgi:hypothetical protein